MSSTSQHFDGAASASGRRSVDFAPAVFPTWSKTCKDLAASVAAGGGVVILVGPGGSGKSTTLAWLASTLPSDKARVRNAGEAVRARVVLDLVDHVDRQELGRLVAAGPRRGTQVLGVGPELLEAAADAFPRARVVRVRPMTVADVRAVIAVRTAQTRLPGAAIAPRAMARLIELCDGNPRQLDRLLGRAALIARAGGSDVIEIDCVERAACLLRLPAMGRRDPGHAQTGRSGAAPSADPATTMRTHDAAWRSFAGRAAILAGIAAAVVGAVLSSPRDTVARIGGLIRTAVPAAPAGSASLAPGSPVAEAPAAEEVSTSPLPPHPAMTVGMPQPASPPVPVPAAVPDDAATQPYPTRLAVSGKPIWPPAARGSPEQAARLLSVAKSMLAIGQVADARTLLEASAEMGDREAAAMVARRLEPAKGPPQSRPDARPPQPTAP